MDLGQTLSIVSIVPFVGMLLSIALFPLFKGEWWEEHQLHVAVFWSLLFVVPFAVFYGIAETGVVLLESIVLDYIPFIVLLFGLFAVAGGIHIGGTIVGTTRNNVIILLIGTLLASWIGTTGAAMLLIRPLIRANHFRRKKAHIIIFFIILVANMGGCLTPLGDPPLFLGFLRGVPFFWTLMHIWPLLAMNTVILLVVFAIMDTIILRKENAGGETPESRELHADAADRVPLRIEGAHNVFFLILIVLAVVLNGVIPQVETFIDPATGLVYGIDLCEGVHLGFNYFLQLILILLAAFGSMKTTAKSVREANDFEWGPIAEVARLFIGIFITMIPVLAILAANGSALGIDSPVKFFWFTGLLSSFLDNSPTYVVFLTAAGAMGAAAVEGIVTTVGEVAATYLLAISAGAVFMGAMTYIGNAPNFMVKNISEKNGIKMPSFFGYIGWTVAILVPLFLIDTVVFFL